MESKTNDTVEKQPKTIRKIIHRDGTVTILDPNDKTTSDMLLSHKHISTKRVRYRKIKSKDPATGEIKIRIEKIEDGDTLASQSTSIFTESVLLQSTIEQPQVEVVEIPMIKENINTRKKKRGLKKKDPAKKKTLTKEECKPKAKAKKLKRNRSQQKEKKEITQDLKTASPQIFEDQPAMLELSESESEDSIDIKKYDPAIYEFESCDPPEKEEEKPKITELRYKRVITQRRNANTNVIEAVEVLEPYEGKSLPEGLKRHKIYPLDPITMMPLKDPSQENNNIDAPTTPQLAETIRQEAPTQNNNFISEDVSCQSSIKKVEFEIPKGPRGRKKSRAKKRSAEKECELTIDDLLMFASSSSIDEGYHIHKRNRVYFKWTPINYVLDGQNLMTNKVEYIPKQVSIKEKIPKNKPKKAKNIRKEKPEKRERYLEDNDAVAPFTILDDEEFIKTYGSLRPELPPFLEEVPKELDSGFPTELLVPIKPPIIQIGDKFFLEKIENGILTQYRCTEDGKRIILVMKDEEKKQQQKKRRLSKVGKIRRKKSSTSMFDATSMPNSESLVSLPVSDFDRSMNDDRVLQKPSPLQILLDDDEVESIRTKRPPSPPPHKHHENPFGHPRPPKAPPAFIIGEDRTPTPAIPKPEKHVRILPLPPAVKPPPPAVKPLHLMRVSSASQIELDNLSESATEEEEESEYEYTEDTQAMKTTLAQSALSIFKEGSEESSSPPMLMTSEESGHGLLMTSSASFSSSPSLGDASDDSAEAELEAEAEEEEETAPSVSEPKPEEAEEMAASGVEASAGERPYEMLTAQIERETSVSFTEDEEEAQE